MLEAEWTGGLVVGGGVLDERPPGDDERFGAFGQLSTGEKGPTTLVVSLALVLAGLSLLPRRAVSQLPPTLRLRQLGPVRR